MITKTKHSTLYFGILAEYFAALFLILKGYHILHRRFYCKHGEIDLIARKAKTIIFIEVKARKQLENCFETITKTKQKKLQKTIEYYLATHPNYIKKPLRIDAIFIGLNRLPKHIQNII